ncbi:MAG: DinB family protein [Gemmatimonadaceae bacterium]
MTQVLTVRYRRWFEYERDSHARTLASLHAMPVELRTSPFFEKAASLLAHIIAARRLWLFRLGMAREAPSEFFPRGVSLSDLDTGLREMQAAWSSYLDSLDDARLEHVFEYQSLEGGWYRNSIEDILTQLFGHSWYHRGQIAALVRSAGGEPAATDFVFWTRELLER